MKNKLKNIITIIVALTWMTIGWVCAIRSVAILIHYLTN